jgi:hypothetical protein
MFRSHCFLCEYSKEMGTFGGSIHKAEIMEEWVNGKVEDCVKKRKKQFQNSTV